MEPEAARRGGIVLSLYLKPSSKRMFTNLPEGGALRAASIASLSMVAIPGINELSVPFFGVPLTVLAMAAAGATLSFAYGEPLESRKKLFTLAIANTFLAAILVAVIPQALGWEWTNTNLEPPLAGIVAIAARWVVPNFIDLVPEVLRKVFRLEKYDRIYRGTDSSYDVDYTKYYEDSRYEEGKFISYDDGLEEGQEKPEVVRRGRKKKV